VIELVDIGANLANRAFRADLDQVLDRARAAGVTAIVVTGTSAEVSAAAAEMAVRHGLYATAGIHPHHAKDADAGALEAVAALLGRPEVVAVGECGLDYNRMFSPREAQRRCFEAQLTLAATSGKPIFLHERDASDDFIAILRERRRDLGAAVVHCFTGDRAALQAYLSLDLHVGITGWICDDRRGLPLRALVGEIPRDRLMLETDAPYLLPRTLSPPPPDRRNEPAFLPLVLHAVAGALGRPPADVATDTTATARAFFRLSVGSRQTPTSNHSNRH
jgi:TatD DNase family protein